MNGSAEANDANIQHLSFSRKAQKCYIDFLEKILSGRVYTKCYSDVVSAGARCDAATTVP